MRSRIPRKELEMLARVPLFSGCTAGELRQIARLGTELEVMDEKLLTRQGARGHEFFLVVDGRAKCEVQGRKVAVFGPGDYFGELALLDGGTRTATVKAVGPMRVSVLSASEFAGLLHSSPSISRKLLANLAGRFRDAQSTLTL